MLINFPLFAFLTIGAEGEVALLKLIIVLDIEQTFDYYNGVRRNETVLTPKLNSHFIDSERARG